MSRPELDDLVGRVTSRLDERGIAHRLIGAAALAVHGVARSTQDVDLLVADVSVLDADLWRGVAPEGVETEVRRGDDADPLVGVVRFEEEIADDRSWDDPPFGLDVVVVRRVWVGPMLTSPGRAGVIGGRPLVAVAAADLVLLKLYAGGPRDAWDITALLEAQGAAFASVVADIDARVALLPKQSVDLWARIRADLTAR